MPIIGQGTDLEQFTLATNHYGFSATRIDQLQASEFTLVSLLFDTSGSTSFFRNEMKKALQDIIKACSKSPRKDNLMFRVCEFGSRNKFNEMHGFKLLQHVDPNDPVYDALLTSSSGATALFDAAENAISATAAYAKTLYDNDYSVNGITFILTDGMDNHSKLPASAVKDALSNAIKGEMMESLLTILVGVNLEPGSQPSLANFAAEAGITKYVDIGEASPGKLAKFAEFVSRSVSLQSSAIGSGKSTPVDPNSLTF